MDACFKWAYVLFGVRGKVRGWLLLEQENGEVCDSYIVRRVVFDRGGVGDCKGLDLTMLLYHIRGGEYFCVFYSLRNSPLFIIKEWVQFFKVHSINICYSSNIDQFSNKFFFPILTNKCLLSYLHVFLTNYSSKKFGIQNHNKKRRIIVAINTSKF